MVKRVQTFAAIAAIVFVVSSCYLDDFKNISADKIRIEGISPSFGFPLFKDSISIGDFLPDNSDFIILDDDMITIRISQGMNFDLDLNTFKVPDKDFENSLNIVPYAFEIYRPDYVTIENDSEIKSVKLKSGNLFIEFERNYTGDDVNIKLEVYSLIVEGFPQGVVFAPDWSSNPYYSRTDVNLNDAVLNLFVEDDEDIFYNTFSYAITLESEGGTTGNLTFRIGFSNIEFSRMTGKVIYDIEMPAQEMNFDALSSVIDGEIYFSDPSIMFDIGTSFGMPSSIELTELKFVNSSNDELPLQNIGTDLSSAFLLGGLKNFLPYATETLPFDSKTLILNSSNSNIDQVLPFTPTGMSMKGKFSLGEAETPPDDPHNFFVNDTSSFNLNLQVEVPVAGSIKELKFTQQIEDLPWTPLDSIAFLSDFDFDIELRIKTHNSIPLTLAIQAIFLDENDNPVAYLFDEDDNIEAKNLIKSPIIDSQGNPIEPMEQLTKVKLNKEKYELLSSSSKVELVLTIDTGKDADNNYANVVIRPSHQCKVQMAIKFNLEIEPDI